MKNIKVFTSGRERKLWIWVFVVFIAIFSTLFIGQPLVRIFSDQNIQAIIFVIVMILVGLTIVVHGLKTKPRSFEWAIIIGIVAVYIMFILRLGMPERSHLMEYSVLAIFIHKALSEREKNGGNVPRIELLTILLASMAGVLDESIQAIIPNRVFDLQDIFFNIFACIMAVAVSWTLGWAKRISSKFYTNKANENNE